MTIKFIIINCVLIITLCGCFKKNTLPIPKNKYAYVMQKKITNNKPSPYLIQIDLENLKISNKIKVNKYYSYLTLLENGSLLLTHSRDGISLKQKIDKFNVHTNKITSFIKTKAYYPSSVIPFKKEFFVLLDAHSNGDLILEKFNKKGKFISQNIVAKESMCIYGSIMLSKTQDSLWLFLKDFSNKINSIPRGISINLQTKKIDFLNNNFSKELGSINAVSFNKKEDKIYISPLIKEKRNIIQKK